MSPAGAVPVEPELEPLDEPPLEDPLEEEPPLEEPLLDEPPLLLPLDEPPQLVVPPLEEPPLLPPELLLPPPLGAPAQLAGAQSAGVASGVQLERLVCDWMHS